MQRITVKKQKGFMLVEMIVYMTIMVVIMLAIVNVIILIAESNKYSSIETNIKNSAISGMEEMTREIRNAVSIDDVQSDFDSTTDGILFLNTLDQDGNNKTIKFYLQDKILKEDIGGVATSTTGILTTKDVEILSMTFKKIDTINSKAVKIEMIFSGSDRGLIKNENFYSTIVLRGSY